MGRDLARGALLLTLALAACGKAKTDEPGVPDLAALRAKRDSLKLTMAADSTTRVRYAVCTDSVTTALGKTAAGKKKLAVKPPEGMIRPEVLSACGKPPALATAAPAPATPVTSPAAAPATSKPGTASVPSNTTASKPVAGTPVGAPASHPAPAVVTPVASPAAAPATPVLNAKQLAVLRADSIRKAQEQQKAQAAEQAQQLARADSAKKVRADSVRTDSLRRAHETEVLRETFSYSGSARDPYVSLISSAKIGPEFSDLLLVGIYQDLRYASNSVAVLRDKTSGKRYKLRVGDQVGRLKVAQIRQSDIVFTIADFGFERQETLSLRKREAETP
jgi:hypothetical protein